MQSGPAIVLHPAMSRTPWHVAFLLAASEFARYSALTAAVVVGGTIAVLLVLVLAVVAAPLGAAIVTWLVWRSAQHGAGHVRRLTVRARRRARALGLRVVRD
jgi:hypothetical protein